jgi:small subunit ribosomal protein S1
VPMNEDREINNSEIFSGDKSRDFDARQDGFDFGAMDGAFESLLGDSFEPSEKIEGRVVKATVLSIEDGNVLLDVGLKSEGVVPLKEFLSHPEEKDIKVGDIVQIYIERYENKKGEVVVNREKARQRSRWTVLQEKFEAQENIEGTIFSRVKGGFLVDLVEVMAFLPGSQVELRQVRDGGPEINDRQEFRILKMDIARGNIVVSRRAVVEEARKKAQSELFDCLEESKAQGKSLKLEGVVKNLVHYGAFVDLGRGVDGLLYTTDISWKRLKNPSEALDVGQKIQVVIKSFDRESGRISLRPLSLEGDPWLGIQDKYSIGDRVKGQVVSLTDYGAFVRLDDGVDGLLHVSEMSWLRKCRKPKDLVSVGDIIDIQILEVDAEKRRISVGRKQCLENPLKKFQEDHPIGSLVEGVIQRVTDFGVLAELSVGDEAGEVVEGTAFRDDLSWEYEGHEALRLFKNKEGEKVTFKLLDLDSMKGIVRLGIKQLTEDTFQKSIKAYSVGQTVACEVAKVLDNGIEVSFENGSLRGFIKKVDLSRDRLDQKSDRFNVGEKIDVKITGIDLERRKISLSIKAMELADEEAVLRKYTADQGSSLGNILGAAIEERDREAEEVN